jgi:xanthine/CO dehydrogenase XdhC/CoxF family maturation factor
MKHWQETSQLLTTAARLAGAGQRAALATVVRISGSAYRRPGAKLLVAADGQMCGSVSGGCLEADVRENALHVIRDGTPRLLHYDTGSDDTTVWGLGMGCNGAVDVFVQPAEGGSPDNATVLELLRGDRPFAISTVIEGPGLGSRRVTVGEAPSPEPGVFVEAFVPPPRLFICGAGDDSIPLAAFATEVGFRVTLLDHRAGYLTLERFSPGVELRTARSDQGFGTPAPGANGYVVIKTHSLAHDRTWLRRALDSEAGYIGLLGPRPRVERLIEEAGTSSGDRVFGPVGLDLAAEGAEQIALSIVAELMAVRAARVPRHLREKESAIHAR